MFNGRFLSDSIYGAILTISLKLGRTVVPIENWSFWTRLVRWGGRWRLR